MNHIWFEKRSVTPSKIICVGRNYAAHIEELSNETPDRMVLFNKPNSALSPSLYSFGDKCRFEGELCFLVEKKRLVGVGFGLDLTKVDEQEIAKEKGLPWERAKAFDGSAVMGEFVPLQEDMSTLEMKLYQNGAMVQHAKYELMLHKPREVLKEIQSFMQPQDGDVIMSGTPKGVGYYKIGDIFKAQILLHGNVINETELTVKPFPAST
jgi:2-keto-4-pentenoate hydratase/2-oxohepta-3-ene-1,7-dioic acid hydratase in catechol pathway